LPSLGFYTAELKPVTKLPMSTTTVPEIIFSAGDKTLMSPKMTFKETPLAVWRGKVPNRPDE
jgi:hypothetical protein